eukprot:scaffold18392_cov129-Isochrysis_galbana.AAC.3
MSHCAAHHVTHALSLAEKPGNGRANRMLNQCSSPTRPAGAPGGQSGKRARSTRREAERALSPLDSRPDSRRESAMTPSYPPPSSSRPTPASLARARRKVSSHRRSTRLPSGPLDAPSRHT